MTRNTASLSVIAGISLLALIAGLVVVSRSGEEDVFSGPWRRWFAHPRAATVDEQREFMRLSLETMLEAPSRSHAGSSAHAAPASPTRTPRIALNAVPSRRCSPMPQIRWCEPDAAGRTLMSETPPPSAKKIERVPIALRRALVQAKPLSARLPDPGVPGVVVYNDGTKLSAENERLVLALFRREVPGALGHVFFTWAVVSVDGQSALMDVVAMGGVKGRGYSAIEVFKREPTGWRWVERLTY